MHVCTIIAKNYVAYARVLAESFREHNPDGTCWVLVIDDYDGYIDPADEPFETVSPDALEIEHFDRMAALYSVLELSTAVKPWLLRYLLYRLGCERITYLDPDIRIYDSIREVDDLLQDHRMVVTPHLTEPMPRDGAKPSETDILIAGAYNLGFIGLSAGEDTDHLLGWWAERLERDCIVAPDRGYFVDQRWIDFAPGLVKSFNVLRDPGYNVAYWNLPSRELRRTGGGVEVNARPLRFFHFSGYDPRRPDELSLHQNRIRLDDDRALRALCDEYGRELTEAGFEDTRDWPYPYDELPDGLRLDAVLRGLYREAEAAGELNGSIFTPEGTREFVGWLNGPAEVGAEAGVTRYLYALRERRQDLAADFRDLSGGDATRYVAWAEVFGRTEVPIPEPLLPSAADGDEGRAALPAPHTELPTSGVNVAGYFRSVLGVGEVARQIVTALETQGIPIAIRGLGAEASAQSEEFDDRPSKDEYGTNLICVNADMVEPFVEQMGPDFLKDRYSIGVWWWEVSSFPERWIGSFNYLDEVWVCTRHIADTLAGVSPIPVVKITLPVSVPDFEPLDRAALGLPEGFLFLFVFDYNSVFERKNPLALVDAFSRAFEPGSGASLVLKSINHEGDPDNHERLIAAAAAHPDVHVIDRYVSRAEKDAMIAACDCYASLHRAEGFGITLAEAMYMGKPVIGTAYSGNLDFMTPANSYLVDYRLVTIGEGADPYPADGEWAEPDTDDAAALMREVFERPDEASERARRGMADIRERHSPQAAGKALVERLLRVQLRPWAGGHVRPGAGAHTVDTGWLEERIASGPVQPPPRSRLRRLKQFARRLVLRVIKPYTAHQQMVDRELLKSVRKLDEGMRALGTSSAAAGQRLDVIVDRLDRLNAEVEQNTRFVSSFGLRGGSIAEPSADVDSYPEAPREPWTPDYFEGHRKFVSRALDDPALLALFRRGGRLPEGYGVGFDERVVELPWLFTRDLTGSALDAGSTLNHAHVLARIQPRLDDLHIATLAPEPEAFPFMRVSYVFADLRDLPMRDGQYDVVVCLSTLEHVGMDNSQYGGGDRSPDPDAELRAALGELRRVLKPGGRLLVTVPFGEPGDFGWMRQLSSEGLDAITEAFGPSSAERRFYRYGEGGWQISTEDEAAHERYRDHYTTPEPAADRAVAARAVACLDLVA